MPTPFPPLTGDEISPDYIRQLIGADARVILDIGANQGWHTAAFANMFANATVYAFEPDTRAIEKFSSNVKSSRMLLDMLEDFRSFHENRSLTYRLPVTAQSSQARYCL